MGRTTRDELETENTRLGERIRDLEGALADRDSKVAEQASDALGAAAVQIGPNARALAHWLHYVLGLSFAKAFKVLASSVCRSPPGRCRPGRNRREWR